MKNNIEIMREREENNLSRYTIRIALARLEGARKVSFRGIGMARVYMSNGGMK
jgi:hypothetical protein